FHHAYPPRPAACDHRAQTARPRRSLMGHAAAFNQSNLYGSIARLLKGNFAAVTRPWIAAKIISADVDQLAFRIEPNFSADIPPSLAKGEILADVNRSFFVDHAIEKSVALSGLET